MSSIITNNRRASFLFSFAVSLALFSVLAGRSDLWEEGGVSFILSSFWGVVASGVLLLIALGLARFKFQTISVSASGFTLGLVVLFFSDWLTRGYSLLQGPSIRGEIILGALLIYIVIKACGWKVLKYLTPLICLIFSWNLLRYSGGGLLFSDDHPVFFYRLSLLKAHFPFVPSYDTCWNAGLDTTHLFASGSLNFYLLVSPLVEFFNVESVYNLSVALVVESL